MPTSRPLHFDTCLHRDALAVWCGVWLMLVQTVGTAEHVSAMAAAAAGAPADGPLGFLHICTAQGLMLRPGGDPAAPQGDAAIHGCALCAMACAAGSAILPDLPLLPAPPVLRAIGKTAASAFRIVLFSWRYGIVRGPPLTSFVLVSGNVSLAHCSNARVGVEFQQQRMNGHHHGTQSQNTAFHRLHGRDLCFRGRGFRAGQACQPH